MTQRSAARVVLLTCAVLALATPAHADEAFTPWHVARVRTVTAVAPSPDGHRLAYVLSVPREPMNEPDGPAWEELHVVPTDGGAAQPFVTGQVNVRQPEWMPDGSGLLFLAKRGGDATRSLYLIPAEGGEARRVLTFDADINAYDLSPDGSRVAFLARPPRPDRVKELEKKGFTQEIYEESVRHVEVYVAALESKGQAPRSLQLEGSASEALWSPDGRRLAVVLAPTALVDDDLMQRRVHVLDAASGRIEANLQNPGKLGRVAWSPDGRRIAIVTGEDLNDPAAGRLWIAPAAGGSWTDLLPGYGGHVRDFVWQDSSTLAFVGDEGVETVLAAVGSDGTGRRTLVEPGHLIINELQAPAKGNGLALLGETPRHPAEVFTLQAAQGSPMRLTDSNPWLADMRFAPQQVVSFKTRDGLELQGILIRPLGEPAGARAPLILTVHGGPESHDRNGWRTSYSSPGQVGAAQGFAVFYPNYRGSTGRGVAFSKLGQGDPAGREFDDLVDAVDHLVATGLVDKAKVGITGGSYGGYATAWSSTYYTERFAAGVMFVGISDKISKTGTTDIANEEYLVHARKRPWEDWQFFLERSPIYHSANARTPLLILHGKEDPRVNPTQSLELYRYLKLHDKAPVRLVWYPGEQHGNRRAAARLDYSLRLMRWFRHFLQEGGTSLPEPELEYAAPDGVLSPTAAAARP